MWGKNMKNKVKNLIKYAILLFILPFLVEFIIKYGPYRENAFNNDIWFSFMGSYIGAIVTVIVFQWTINENNKNHIKEMGNQRKIKIIENEIELINEMVNAMLLDKYNFFTYLDQMTKCIEYNKWWRDMWDNVANIEKLCREKDEKNTARDSIIKKIYDMHNYYTVIISLKQPNVFEEINTNMEKIKVYANNNREELLKLRKLYIDEMNLEIYNLQRD